MLNSQIREAIQQFRTAFPPEVSALIEQGAGEISALDIVENALGPGDRVPAFDLSTHNGERRSLDGLLSRGPLVLTFYRGVWCPYCNLQLKAYEGRLSEIRARGAELVAVTPEQPGAFDILKDGGAPPEVLSGVVETVSFDVLHDPENQLARQFGLVFTLPDAHRQILEMINVDVERLNGDGSFAFPDPATYVIRPDGTIAWAFVPNNYRKRAEVNAILSALDGLDRQAA